MLLESVVNRVWQSLQPFLQDSPDTQIKIPTVPGFPVVFCNVKIKGEAISKLIPTLEPYEIRHCSVERIEVTPPSALQSATYIDATFFNEPLIVNIVNAAVVMSERDSDKASKDAVQDELQTIFMNDENLNPQENKGGSSSSSFATRFLKLVHKNISASISSVIGIVASRVCMSRLSFCASNVNICVLEKGSQSAVGFTCKTISSNYVKDLEIYHLDNLAIDQVYRNKFFQGDKIPPSSYVVSPISFGWMYNENVLEIVSHIFFEIIRETPGVLEGLFGRFSNHTMKNKNKSRMVKFPEIVLCKGMSISWRESADSWCMRKVALNGNGLLNISGLSCRYFDKLASITVSIFDRYLKVSEEISNDEDEFVSFLDENEEMCSLFSCQSPKSTLKISRETGYKNFSFSQVVELMNLLKDFSMSWDIQVHCPIRINDDDENSSLIRSARIESGILKMEISTLNCPLYRISLDFNSGEFLAKMEDKEEEFVVRFPPTIFREIGSSESSLLIDATVFLTISKSSSCHELSFSDILADRLSNGSFRVSISRSSYKISGAELLTLPGVVVIIDIGEGEATVDQFQATFKSDHSYSSRISGSDFHFHWGKANPIDLAQARISLETLHVLLSTADTPMLSTRSSFIALKSISAQKVTNSNEFGFEAVSASMSLHDDFVPFFRSVSQVVSESGSCIDRIPLGTFQISNTQSTGFNLIYEDEQSARRVLSILPFSVTGRIPFDSSKNCSVSDLINSREFFNFSVCNCKFVIHKNSSVFKFRRIILKRKSDYMLEICSSKDDDKSLNSGQNWLRHLQMRKYMKISLKTSSFQADIFPGSLQDAGVRILTEDCFFSVNISPMTLINTMKLSLGKVTIQESGILEVLNAHAPVIEISEENKRVIFHFEDAATFCCFPQVKIHADFSQLERLANSLSRFIASFPLNIRHEIGETQDASNAIIISPIRLQLYARQMFKVFVLDEVNLLIRQCVLENWGPVKKWYLNEILRQWRSLAFHIDLYGKPISVVRSFTQTLRIRLVNLFSAISFGMIHRIPEY